MAMLPNWIIVGAPKAGTSSLFSWLVAHPEVEGSREKETYFFVDPGTHMFRPDRSFSAQGLLGYERLFRPAGPGTRVLIEATPAYMYSETALKELVRLPSQPHFIFLLREPVEQIKSLYTYFRENWDWIPRSMSFRDFVAAAERGSHGFRGNELARHALGNADYLGHLERWRAACGLERMHVFTFEAMLADKRGFLKELSRRMGIDQHFYDNYAFVADNESYVVRSPLIQRVNISIRSAVPKGWLFHALRRVYRLANTRKVRAAAALDTAVEAALSRRYLPGIEELELRFGLDLATWRRALVTRIEAVPGAVRLSAATGEELLA